VKVGVRVTRIGRSSMTMEHVVWSEAANRVAAEVVTTIVMLDYANGRSTPVTDEQRQTIEKFEGRPLLK
jgi:acyl-CoA thioester hydrolase